MLSDRSGQHGMDQVHRPKEPHGLGPVTYQDSRTYLLHYDFVTAHGAVYRDQSGGV
jgi:hypothetical protein